MGRSRIRSNPHVCAHCAYVFSMCVKALRRLHTRKNSCSYNVENMIVAINSYGLQSARDITEKHQEPAGQGVLEEAE